MIRIVDARAARSRRGHPPPAAGHPPPAHPQRPATQPRKRKCDADSNGSNSTPAAMTSEQSSPACDELAGPSIHDLAHEHRLVGVR